MNARRLLSAVFVVLAVLSTMIAPASAGEEVTYDVTVRVNNRGDATIIGDNHRNNVELCQLYDVVNNQPFPDEYVLILRDDAFQFHSLIPVEGATGRIVFNMRGGDDIVEINSACNVSDIVAYYPDRSSFSSDVRFIGGSGSDRFTMTNSNVVRDVIASGGSGDDAMEVIETDIGDDLTVLGSSGVDRAGAIATLVNDLANINLGSSEGLVSIEDSDIGRTLIRGGTSDDHILITGSDLGAGPRILTSRGQDTIAVGSFGTVPMDWSGRFLMNTGPDDDDVTMVLGVQASAPLGWIDANLSSGDDLFVLEDGELFENDRLNGASGTDDTLLLPSLPTNADVRGFESIGPVLVP